MMPATSTHSLPLLTTMVRNHRSTHRPWNLATLTHYLYRLCSRQLMRDSLLRVRLTASEYLEQCQAAFWPAAIFFLLVCKIVFIVASINVMIMSVNEGPQVQLRAWIVGYAIKCIVHGVYMGLECKKKLDRLWASDGENSETASDTNSGSERNSEDVLILDHENVVQDERDDEDVVLNFDHQDVVQDIRDSEDVVLNVDHVDVVQDHGAEEQTRVAKHLDSAITVLSFIWWTIGIYWIYTAGQNLIRDSPQLYWLCITFLVFDALIVFIHIAVACVVGLAVCFSLSCILAILYTVTNQEEEIEDCIQRLPKYRFQRTGVFCEEQNGHSQNEEIQESPCGKMIECNTNRPTEHVLPLEDAICCICLCAYEEGRVLCRLPCRHHFHSDCIVKWLNLNPTCPLCNTNIFNYDNNSDREQVFNN